MNKLFDFKGINKGTTEETLQNIYNYPIVENYLYLKEFKLQSPNFERVIKQKKFGIISHFLEIYDLKYCHFKASYKLSIKSSLRGFTKTTAYGILIRLIVKMFTYSDKDKTGLLIDMRNCNFTLV